MKLNRQLLGRALIVSSVVGSVLLLINQFDAVLGAQDFRLIPAVLTYCVPFFVFLVGSNSRPL